jgi:large subunit ribosomal protein L18
MMTQHTTGRTRRHNRIRMKVKGTAQKPRLSVFRSNTQVICQLVDDVNGVTLAAASGRDLGAKAKGTKTERAAQVGQLLAERALAKKVTEVVFDRGGYKYHGRIKAVAEELRQKGLQF